MMKLILVPFLSLLFAGVFGHGILTDPRQRGALRLDNHLVPTVNWNAPTDYSGHFPAGSKDRTPGAGTASLRQASGNFWTPYEPFNRAHHWRVGVCGDELGGPQDHLRGGRYYFDAYRVREYVQGSVIFMESEIVTHHNGFFEFYICNIDTCGDDISVRCFHEGHCQQLMRAPGPCDSGVEMGCGPIDRRFPGRWYLPCRTSEPMMVGGWSRTMAYTLPRDLVCDHCVIQWYWTSANTCNPAGVHEYFTGPDAPNWGNCPGQGGAVGGWTWNKPACGGPNFSEEYFQCADVRIVPNPQLAAPPPPPPTPPPPPPPPPPPRPQQIPQGSGTFAQGPQSAVQLNARHPSPSPSSIGVSTENEFAEDSSTSQVPEAAEPEAAGSTSFVSDSTPTSGSSVEGSQETDGDGTEMPADTDDNEHAGEHPHSSASTAFSAAEALGIHHSQT